MYIHVQIRIFSALECAYKGRSFPFCKGHFHWKILESMANFRRGTKSKTRATEAMSSVDSMDFQSEFNALTNITVNKLKEHICGKLAE